LVERSAPVEIHVATRFPPEVSALHGQDDFQGGGVLVVEGEIDFWAANKIKT